ncbi:DUF885 family protein [uncultured Sphingomonas sp.]|uniref:DUF885 domain-containing protein n=1 Tax=uncultured Sphingomonas sp. TaxID=158754 RepID=UPI0025CE4166|nr:DUF885 family protein [uncultured Sphingomonas sp.]
MRSFLLALSASAFFVPAIAAPLPADARFKAIYTSEQAWRETQESGGEDNDRVAAHLPDVRPAAQTARLAYLQGVLRQLDALPKASLGQAAAVDYAVYRFDIERRVAALRTRDYEMPANSDSSPWGDLGYVARGQFRTETDYRNWITQLREVPRFFDDQIANMRAGLARGWTPPRITLEARDAAIAQVADAKSPEDSLLFQPFRTMPANIPAATQAALKQEARAAITGQAQPAYAKLLAFFRNDYVPHTRTTLAADALPGGTAWYADQIRAFATVDLSADQIHAIGLAEVARIKAEMQTVMRETGFKGDLPAFLTFLRTDPQFYVTTPQALLDRAAWTAKQVDAKVGLYIGHLPRRRFAIVPVPDDIAPFYTAGRGGPGQYLVNTYDLKSRPLYQLPALTLHESAPGHAFQMPLAAENKGQPAFRQHLYISAYGEGWALYCERLGDEMGIYATPYERFGMLSYQMWRAGRLVVDTGIHAKGWTRDRAQAFLRDNTALSEHEVTTEVDRYISWPGQALSYYLGMMAIRDARAKTERALGAKFNVRAFHDVVLDLGSVPLPILTARIDRFIADGGKGPYPDEE